MFNEYNIRARFFPTIICSVPLLIFQFFFLNDELREFFNFLGQVRWLGNITISIVVFYLLSQINRFFGKDIFEKLYFSDELQMPTTTYLLYSDEKYSNEYKKKISEKIKSDFDFVLLSAESEKLDELEAKKRIVEAVGLIREKVGSGKLLLQHNIEYGFIRNLIGGAVIAFPISVLNSILFYSGSWISFLVAIGFSLFFGLLILFSKKLIFRKGELYARRLFSEYLN